MLVIGFVIAVSGATKISLTTKSATEDSSVTQPTSMSLNVPRNALQILVSLYQFNLSLLSRFRCLLYMLDFSLEFTFLYIDFKIVYYGLIFQS